MDSQNFKSMKYNFIFGIIILFPFFFMLGETPIYPFPLLFNAILIIIYYFRVFILKHKTNKGNFDNLVLLYLIWIVLSYITNVIISFDFRIEDRRFISLCMSILMISSYFVGKEYLTKRRQQLYYFTSGILITYLIVNIFELNNFFSGLEDLYMLRVDSSQRLPFVVAYVSTVAGVLSFFWKKQRMYLLIILFLGVLVVLFSLTRGAYLQMSLGIIFIIALYIRKKAFTAIILIFSIIAIFVLISNSEISGFQQIFGRWEQLSDLQWQSEEDPSGSYRVILWRKIVGRLNENPIRWLIGFGELSPTIVTGGDRNGSETASSAHNQYLDLIVRNGIIGLSILIIILFKTIIKGFKGRPKINSIDDNIYVSNSFALIGIMSYSFFHETFRYPLFAFYFWTYVGMVSQNSCNNMQNNKTS